MEDIISDPSISSCQEMQEEAERAAVEAIAQRMRDIVRLAFEENDAIVRETNELQEQLSNELRFIAPYQEQLTGLQDWAREQLSVMLEIQSQLTDVNLDSLNLLSSLQELREQHQAAFHADPINALIEEERQLQQQLEERGIIVHPSTDSDEYVQ